MSRFKRKKRAYFRSGLSLLGEKKVFSKNVFDQSLPKTAKPKEEFNWTKPGVIYDDIDGILQGTGKNQRIGQKIYLRYITVNLEIYSEPGGTETDFPYVRVLFAKDRAANAIVNDDLPTKRLERPNVSRINVLSDECVGMASTYQGASESQKAIIKVTKTFKMMTSIQFNSGNVA